MVASKSPRPALAGKPLPLRRNVRPLEVHGGTVISTGLSSVGTRPRHALTFEPDVLAVHDADRNLAVDVLAVRQVQPLRRSGGRIRQRNRHLGLNVGADTEILRLEVRAGTAAAAAAAEGFAQNILEAAEPAAATTVFSATAPAPVGAGEAFRTKTEAFEIGVAAEAGARIGAAAAKTLEALEAGFALGIDLAAIERLALVLVLEDLVRGVQLGKARRRLRIVLVGVGMQFLCQAPISALDVGRARLAIDPQDLIGITHPQATPLVFRAGPAAPACSMWDESGRLAMRRRIGSACRQ